MYNLYLPGSGLCLPYPTLDTRLSLILRPVSGPSMAGLGVFEGGGSEELDGVLLHAFIFFSTDCTFSFASSGILRETVSGPRLTRVDVIVMNKDYVSRDLQSIETIKAAENSWG